jgi:hypothetical protein
MDRVGIRLAMASVLLLLGACTFEPPPAAPFIVRFPPDDGIPLSPLVESSSRPVFEDPGNLVVFHGLGCAESNRDGLQFPLRVRQAQPIPSGLDRAAVILNGWHFRYLEGDHEVEGLGSSIQAIGREPIEGGTQLAWDAFGAIAEGDFDEPYRWCYRFTVLAWRSEAYQAFVDQSDRHAFAGDAPGAGVPFGWQTALAYHPAFVEVSPRGGARTAVILPRGFGFRWRDFGDRNLLQLAYNLEPGDAYLADGKHYVVPSPTLGGSDQAGISFYSWETKTVFKDNALRHDYWSGEIVSVASGPAVEAIQPPFTIVPAEDHGNCVSFGDPDSASGAVEGVPFDVAIPMLTGWSLSYDCNDQHVQEIGFWIDDFSYDPGGSGSAADGKLTYRLRSILHDEDRGNAASFRHRVSILGLRRSPPMPPSASLSLLPDVMRFPYPNHTGQPVWVRSAFLDNTGNAPAIRRTVLVSGPDAAAFELVSQHLAPRTLIPGTSEQFTVRLAVPPCGSPPLPGGAWRASLLIGTSEGPFELPLVGLSSPCPIAERQSPS